jgi:hypothetical protein
MQETKITNDLTDVFIEFVKEISENAECAQQKMAAVYKLKHAISNNPSCKSEKPKNKHSADLR